MWPVDDEQQLREQNNIDEISTQVAATEFFFIVMRPVVVGGWSSKQSLQGKNIMPCVSTKNFHPPIHPSIHPSVCYTVKGKVHPITGHEGPEVEWGYCSTLSLTSALYRVGWSTPHPSRFNPGKTQYPLYRRLGGPQGWSGWVRKISPPPGFDPQTVQPIASGYTDWAIPAHLLHSIGD